VDIKSDGSTATTTDGKTITIETGIKIAATDTSSTSK
jgi:hypothetical protein